MRPIAFVPANTNVAFIRQRFIAFAISAALSVASVVLFFAPGLNYGIDFRGGILMEVRSTQGPADLAEMRAKLSGLGLGSVSLQDFGSANDVLIRIEAQGDERRTNAAVLKVRQEMTGFDFRRVEVVGPKVGGELIEAGAIASILAMLGIAIYVWFRFEWQFGVAALIATFHDVVTTIGLFAIAQIEFNLSTVAAILTIAGYSINDTVVVFDRIRETMRKYKTMEFSELMNRAINDTLSRTILTSGTTMLAVLALVIFGGEVIRSFSVAMVWGIFIGTYSSIFLAAPLLLYMRPPRPTEPPAAKPTP
ncbi:MAG: protein translocase subunit SecF [Rhodospirillales bacterium]|nr:protein translocase subunit SecF [Rhodospirillales bacterium]